MLYHSKTTLVELKNGRTQISGCAVFIVIQRLTHRIKLLQLRSQLYINYIHKH